MGVIATGLHKISERTLKNKMVGVG
jgi:hypothetical protein